MEFQSGPNAPLKPVWNCITGSCWKLCYFWIGAGEALSSWSLQLTDEQRKIQILDIQDEVKIPGKWF
jgi:hypothetical protein